MFSVPACAHRSPLFSRWHDIANMSHNKSFFALELASKEETIQFQTVSSTEKLHGMLFPRVSKSAAPRSRLCTGVGGVVLT